LNAGGQDRSSFAYASQTRARSMAANPQPRQPNLWAGRRENDAAGLRAANTARIGAVLWEIKALRGEK